MIEFTTNSHCLHRPNHRIQIPKLRRIRLQKMSSSKEKTERNEKKKSRAETKLNEKF
jgi:hypothetical protein